MQPKQEQIHVRDADLVPEQTVGHSTNNLHRVLLKYSQRLPFVASNTLEVRASVSKPAGTPKGRSALGTSLDRNVLPSANRPAPLDLSSRVSRHAERKPRFRLSKRVCGIIDRYFAGERVCAIERTCI